MVASVAGLTHGKEAAAATQPPLMKRPRHSSSLRVSADPAPPDAIFRVLLT